MMQILVAEQRAIDRHLQVWLDSTKTIVGPGGLASPDPAYVRDYFWGNDVPLAMVKVETRGLALDTLSKLTASATTMPTLQGTTL